VSKGLADQFKVPVSEVPARIATLEAQRRQLEKELGDAKRQLAMGGGAGGAAPAGPEDIGGVKVLARVMEGVGGKDLRPIAEEFKKQLPDGVIALVGSAEGKAAVTVAVTGSAQAKFNAVELAKAAVVAMGGQGAGGRPDFAQGGAPDGAKAGEGLDAIKAALAG
jgi:alanyl-tRNA synthetase